MQNPSGREFLSPIRLKIGGFKDFHFFPNFFEFFLHANSSSWLNAALNIDDIKKKFIQKLLSIKFSTIKVRGCISLSFIGVKVGGSKSSEL